MLYCPWRNAGMANDTISREAKKNQLRRQIISSEELKKNKDYQRRRKQQRFQNWMAVLGAVLIVAAVILGIYLFETFRTYKTFRVEWEKDVIGAESSQFVRLGNGTVQLGADGATYFSDGGETLWSVPYEMRSPQGAVQDAYMIIYDKKGQSLIICDTQGERGRSSTSYAITSADISSQGVAVVLTEEKESSYISYFDSSAGRLEIEIKSPLESQGYPAAISISPDGQQLMVSYLSVSGGAVSSQVVFYDFEEGKDVPNRVVGAFQNYKETDTMVPFVAYMSNQAGVAVGDNMISFYSTEDRTDIQQKNVSITEPIQKVFCDETYLGLVTAKTTEDGATVPMLYLYSAEGVCLLQKELTDQMEHVFLNSGKIVMYEASSCLIQTVKGRTRYDNSFETAITAMLPGGSQREYIVVGDDKIEKVRLQ